MNWSTSLHTLLKSIKMENRARAARKPRFGLSKACKEFSLCFSLPVKCPPSLMSLVSPPGTWRHTPQRSTALRLVWLVCDSLLLLPLSREGPFCGEAALRPKTTPALSLAVIGRDAPALTLPFLWLVRTVSSVNLHVLIVEENAPTVYIYGCGGHLKTLRHLTDSIYTICSKVCGHLTIMYLLMSDLGPSLLL